MGARRGRQVRRPAAARRRTYLPSSVNATAFGAVATATFSAAASSPLSTGTTAPGAVATVTFDVRLAAAPSAASAPLGGITPLPDWRYGVCDLNGRVISLVSRLALNKKPKYRLNRPATNTCAVPSDEPLVNTSHTDGYPYVNEGNRVLKAWRRESGRWVIRFTGHILQLQDEGDEIRLQTLVSAYDPMQRLFRRLVRNSAGSKTADVTFTSESGATIARTLVERTIRYGGPLGISYTGTGSSTSLDGTFAATTAQTVTFPQGTSVGDALVYLTDTDTMDVVFAPLDRQDGMLVEMSVPAQRGTAKPNAVFAYAMGNHSIQSIRRLRDAFELANDVDIYGPHLNLHGHPTPDATSQGIYGVWEDVRILPDINSQTFLDTLAQNEQDLRRNPRETLSISPAPEKGPVPFNEYDVGDTVQVYVGPTLRKTFAGAQRVYGLDLEIDDDGFERVGELIASADAE